MILKHGMQHLGLELNKVCINEKKNQQLHLDRESGPIDEGGGGRYLGPQELLSNLLNAITFCDLFLALRSTPTQYTAKIFRLKNVVFYIFLLKA